MVRRGGHGFALSYFCCFYEILCSVALVPQLWMFQKSDACPALLGDFVLINAVNKCCTLAFWTLYPSVFGRHPDNRGIQMVSEIMNLLILSDFLYYYFRSRFSTNKRYGSVNAQPGDIILKPNDLV